MNPFQSVRPRGEDKPSAVPAPVKAGRPPLLLNGSLVRTMDRKGLWRVPLAPRQAGSISIENRHAARASEDRRQAIKRGGL